MTQEKAERAAWPPQPPTRSLRRAWQAWGELWPRFDRMAAAVWYRNWRAWVRFWRSSVLLNFGEPVMNLLALGIGLGVHVGAIQGVPFAQYVGPGLLAVTAMNAVTFDMSFEGYDRLRTTGVYDAMAFSPLSVPQMVGGELLWEATRSVMYGATFLAVLAALGLVASAWAVAVLPVLALVGLVFAEAALVVVSVARSHEHLFYYFTLAITPMFLFSGVFFPVDQLPGAAQVAVRALPLFHAVELARALILGRLHPGLWVHAAALAVTALVLAPLAVARFRRAVEAL